MSGHDTRSGGSEAFGAAYVARTNGKPGGMKNTTTTMPLPLATHAMIEPFAGILFIAAPFIFGFSDVDDAKTISIVLGAVVLLTGITTRWRMAIVKLIPLGMDRMMDLLVAVVAVASPFVFGFGDIGSATRFFIIMGIAEAGLAMLTRWDPADDFAVSQDRHADGRRRRTDNSPTDRPRCCVSRSIGGLRPSTIVAVSGR
jgi:SPW repeat